MKAVHRILCWIGLICMIVLPLAAMAQVASPTPDPSVVAIPPVSVTDFLGFLLQSLGGFKGASALAIAGLAVQIIMKFLATDLAGQLMSKLPGWAKLSIVTFLSWVGGIVGLMSAGGLGFGAALLHATSLAAFMVFLNQLYQHFIAKTD